MSSSFSSLEEVLGNRDLLQRIARFTLGAANGESETTVPLCLGHTQEWGSLLLVDHFSKDVVSELASTAPLSITFRSPRGLALAASGRFRVRECHLHLESRADMPDLKQAPALCACLRSITLNHWAAVTEEVLEIIKKGCEEEDGTPKLLPKLDTMIIRRVIPPIDALPVQIEHIQLREVLPPYNSTPGGASGLFYLRLQALAGLEALDICYSTEMSTYALKLHSVRLMELLYCPSLRRLRLTVPALHDEADKAMFLGPMFMEQLRTGPLQELDITLVSQIEGDKQEDKQGLARLVQEVCAKAGDVFACTYYGPGEGAHCNDARVILQRRKISRVDTLQGMIRMGQSIGVLQLSEDLTKQVLFSEDMCARVAACGLPVRLRFGWHMTCEECTRLNQLKLRVEGVEWYCKETRGLRALSAPLWKEPEKALRVLRGVDVRGHEKWLPAKFPALAELGLRGRPRASLVPRGCTALSLTYHDVSASTTGLQALKQVRSLRVEHATVTCLPPGITCLELVRCRLVASPRLMEGNTLASLTLDSCSGHGGGSAAGSSNGPPVDLVEWLARTRPHALSVTNTAVSIGTSWADFADQLALSKVASFRFEGCTVVSTLEGTLSQPDGFVDHINRLLDDVFSVVVTPTKGSALYRCSVFRRHSASPEALAAALTAEP